MPNFCVVFTVACMVDTPPRLGRSWVHVVAPVIPIMVLGGVWIALHASGGRGSAHTFFQVLALCEAGIALLLRHRKPVGALAGILAAYALVDLDMIMILPVLLALVTVADLRGRRPATVAAFATGAVVIAMPYMHGDFIGPFSYVALHLTGVALSVAVGRYLRSRRLSKQPILQSVPAGS